MKPIEVPFCIAKSDFAAVVDPRQGGSLRSLKWRGADLMRPQVGAGVLNSACFPLVPFSNRIANSTFDWRGRKIALSPNHPRRRGEPVLHGFGWLLPWRTIEATSSRAVMQLSAQPSGWPWRFECTQTIEISPAGVSMELALLNSASEAMPAGLGFHPFFPLGEAARYHGLHRGEWVSGTDSLPRQLRLAGEARDWWQGEPVGTRRVDTVYTRREGPLRIEWPERDLGITIRPSANLSFTAVYVSEDGGFFCVEPVSHPTDAFNRGHPGVRVLDPGETLTAAITIHAFDLSNEGEPGLIDERFNKDP